MLSYSLKHPHPNRLAWFYSPGCVWALEFLEAHSLHCQNVLKMVICLWITIFLERSHLQLPLVTCSWGMAFLINCFLRCLSFSQILLLVCRHLNLGMHMLVHCYSIYSWTWQTWAPICPWTRLIYPWTQLSPSYPNPWIHRITCTVDQHNVAKTHSIASDIASSSYNRA